ncbi:Aspartyl protease family protein 2, partial [Cucurbita argyrosperma subsp. argyrosperma]
MAPPPLLCFFYILLLSSVSAIADTNPITLPLSSFPHHSSSDPLQTLNFLASASQNRAHQIKAPKSKSNSVSKSPLSPHSYGAYSTPLSFGTPSQTLHLIFDTGSSLVWLPCTSKYLCSECSFPKIDPARIPRFIPKLSSSSKLVGCQNPKCAWIFGPDVKSQCRSCNPKTENCTQTCPAYVVQYGSGSTAGLLLSETLDFPNKKITNFVVGCSFLSIHQPSGIAGFGRGSESLPSQMGLKKFAYCLASRKFDDSPHAGELILDSSGAKTSGLTYTPFRQNPSVSNHAYKEYYYLTIRKIFVGNKAVKVPYKYLVPGPDGNGGSIIDSGSTFTFMDKPVFEAVAQEIEKQLANRTRATDVESLTGLRPCFDISKDKSVEFPELTFHLKGGAKWALPLSNYFALVSSSGVACLTVVTHKAAESGGGPSIILGAFQQQNFYVEYDLVNQKIGFRQQTCS